MSAQVIGGSFSFTTPVAEFELLTESADQDGNVYTYVQADGALGQYDCVVIDETGQAVVANLTTTASAFGDKAGAVQVAFADDEYGWVLRAGVGEVNGLTSCAANVSIHSTATDGHLDDAGTSGAETIDGIVLTTAVGGGGADSVAAHLNYPTVGATL